MNWECPNECELEEACCDLRRVPLAPVIYRRWDDNRHLPALTDALPFAGKNETSHRRVQRGRLDAMMMLVTNS